MINNRQGGRRRGRGGQRPQNLGGRPDGNRQDNRQRGNAAQLLEKYKSMARDAQLAGDRVQTEYYLQFADHYYRVLGESRARFEEQRRQRGEELDEEDSEEEFVEAGEEQRPQDHRRDDDRLEREERFQRPHRSDRFERPERSDRPRRFARDDRTGEEAIDRSNDDGSRSGNGESIAFEALPPAIGRIDSGDPLQVKEDEAPRPRRRTRRPRAAEGEGEVAPAA